MARLSNLWLRLQFVFVMAVARTLRFIKEVRNDGFIDYLVIRQNDKWLVEYISDPRRYQPRWKNRAEWAKENLRDLPPVDEDGNPVPYDTVL